MKVASCLLRGLSVVLVCNMTTIVFANDDFTTDQFKRCRQKDFLNAGNNNALAKGRIAWARKCNFFNDDDVRYHLKRNRYPSYVKNDGRFDAPTDPNASCDGWDVDTEATCKMGCYTPDQLVLFSNRYVKIKDALASETTVTGLTSDASLDKLTYGEHRIEAFISGETKEMVYTFNTKEGTSLQVTEIHPMVLSDGSVIQAKDVKIGMFFLTEEGKKDRVEDIRTEIYEGKVYNLQPVSQNKIENILVAGGGKGILTGSNRYQNEWLDTEFRIRLRRNIDVDGL